MQMVGTVFWIMSLPFRAAIYILRLLAKPGAEYSGLLAAGFWWLSAVGAKNIMEMIPGHPATVWLANFSADANIYAAALTGISIFLMSFIEPECKEDIHELRRRVTELEIALRRLKADTATYDKSSADPASTEAAPHIAM
jgi:hypothetical protein